MPALVTSNFDDDSIKNEWASMETAFSHCKSMGDFLDVQWQLTPKFELIRDFMHVLVTCKYKEDRIKNNLVKGGDTIFPVISQWGLSVAVDTRVLIQSASNIMQPFPNPSDATP